MTQQERDLRNRIAKEVIDKFGGLAPYAMVAKFIKEPPQKE